MVEWNHPVEWKAQLDGSACPICLRGLPLHIVATLESAWLTMPQDAPMPGYVCLVAYRHVVELHDLHSDEATAFMRDMRLVSKALAAATSAVKINCEIHGNTLPHLHMHFFPRHPGDAFEGRAIEPRSVRQPVYAPGQFEALKQRLLLALT